MLGSELWVVIVDVTGSKEGWAVIINGENHDVS